MVDPNLVKYVKEQLSAGFSADQIKEALRTEGWSEKEIADSFDVAGYVEPEKKEAAQEAKPQEKKKEKPKKSPEEVVEVNPFKEIEKPKEKAVEAVVKEEPKVERPEKTKKEEPKAEKVQKPQGEKKPIIGFIMALVGSALIVVNGIFLLLDTIFKPVLDSMSILGWKVITDAFSSLLGIGTLQAMGMIGIVVGVGAAIGAGMLYNPVKSKLGMISCTLMAVLGLLFVGGGFLIGTILAIAGSVVSYILKK